MTIVARQPPKLANGSSVTSVTNILGELPLAGSLLTAQVFADSAVTAVMIGGGVEAWVDGIDAVISGAFLQTFFGYVTETPSETVEVEFSGTASYAELVVGEFTGTSTGAPDEFPASSSGDTDEIIPPTLTLAGAGELVLLQSTCGNAITGNTDNGFTDVFDPVGAFTTYSWQVVSGDSYSPETYTLTAADWWALAIAFLTSSGPAAIGIAGYPFVTGQSVKRASLY